VPDTYRLRTDAIMKPGTSRNTVILCAVLASLGATATAAPRTSAGLETHAGALVPTDSRIAELRQHIVTRMAQTGTAAVSVAVASKGKIIWEEGFGWADRERRIPATQHTMYSLASVTKPMAMTGLMVLVERGLIDLDRPINDYLGDAKLQARVGDARDATVRRVASHTAGLPTHSQFFFEDEPYPLPSMDETILRYGILISAPGERSHYSNLGYGLLGYSIERVSGRSYADFMRDEVFLKLGMTHTSVNIGPGLEDYQAIRYEGDGKRIPFYRIPTPGSGDVYSSAHDMALFGMLHLKHRPPGQAHVLSDASVDELARIPGLISKYGGMPGVATVLQVVPSADMAIVVLANNSWFAPKDRRIKVDEIANRIQQTLAPQAKDNLLPPPPKQPPAPVATLAGTWQGIVHTYLRDLPLTFEILSSGAVKVKLDDQPATLLDGARLEGGWLSGTSTGDIGTPDANRNWPYRFRFGLKQRGDVLNGGLEVDSELLHPPRGETLTYWVELRRKR